MTDDLSKLPAIARDIREIVAGRKPLVESGPLSPATGREDPATAAWGQACHLLEQAARASRTTVSRPVLVQTLSLATIGDLMGCANSAPVRTLGDVGPGLVRLLNVRHERPGWVVAALEFSPLGWPEVADLRTADLNVLFEGPGGAAAVAGEKPTGDPVERFFFGERG